LLPLKLVSGADREVALDITADIQACLDTAAQLNALIREVSPR